MGDCHGITFRFQAMPPNGPAVCFVSVTRRQYRAGSSYPRHWGRKLVTPRPAQSASRVFLHNNGNSLYIYIMNYYHDKDGKTFDDK